MLTELFGLQSYLVNGVRTSTKKGSGRANLFQPSAILDMIVYHNELKQLHRIREFNWAVIYNNILSDVVKNAVALYMIELLTRCLKQPETNTELFHFSEDALLALDRATPEVTGNFPLFFALHLPVFFGLRISDNYSEARPYLDMVEGAFVKEQPAHPNFLEGQMAVVTSQVLKAQHPDEIGEIKLNHEFRRLLLFQYEVYYRLQLQDFGVLKTLPVLAELLN
jgi:DNA repair protein RecO (recombination protein O)